MPKEQYMCQLCANHGIFNQPKKGHKQRCPHKNCSCKLCALNTKRRALDQIERHLKNNNSSDKESSIDHEEDKSLINLTDPMGKASLQQPMLRLTSFSSSSRIDEQQFKDTSTFVSSHLPSIDLAAINNYSMIYDSPFQNKVSPRRSIFHSAEDLAR